MGAIRERSTGSVRLLESDCLVGRAMPYCALAINERYVSTVHAELRWLGQGWQLRDLGSRNGTYLDGRRVTSSIAYQLAKGAQIAFGTREQEWEMIDDSAPRSMAVPVDGREPVAIEDGDMIALPSRDDPRATIYRTDGGAWILERPEELPTALAHGQTFSAAGQVWRFCCPEMIAGTIAVTAEHAEREQASLYVCNLELVFSVSRDEEYVHLRAVSADRDYDLGARQHHFLLLTLARRWLAEAAEGEPEVSRGWLEQEDVAHDPSMAPTRINLAVHRIREQFAKIGVADFGTIVERRLRQLRIGTGRIRLRKV